MAQRNIVETNPTAFQSLVQRSIRAWDSINYVGVEPQHMSRDDAIAKHTSNLSEIESLEALLTGREYWFFQLRDSFLRQLRFPVWDPGHLERYIVLPIDYGFVNNRDCVFVSHFWRTRPDPDPEGVDQGLLRQDLESIEWSYLWLDWTCMPQVPRSAAESAYFHKMLRCIPLLVQDSCFAFRFPPFQPRAWVLFEVATYLLNHSGCYAVDEMKTFGRHLQEMVFSGVQPVMKKYGYTCTTGSDLILVTGWLEILVILFKACPDVLIRQEILDRIFSHNVGSLSWPSLGLEVDKVAGKITVHGEVHTFTPVYHLTSGDPKMGQ